MYFKDFLDKNSKTLIMGILNITPDSFYDGNKYFDSDLSKKISELDRCDIIDIGAESSRPGAKSIDEEDEKNRISKAFKFLINTSKYYSVDTCKPNVASFCIKNGFNMINDITGGANRDMFDIASNYKVPIILMHMQGNPINMQEKPRYNSIIDELKLFFEKRINMAIKHGVNPKNIIIDPGIGFGKTVNQNNQIINNIFKFNAFGCPILIGLSRKSFLTYKSNEPKDRLESSLAVSAIAINNGANIIRTHDIKKSIEVFSVIDRILNK